MGNIYWNNNIEETVLDEFWHTGRRICNRRDKTRVSLRVEDLDFEDLEAITNSEYDDKDQDEFEAQLTTKNLDR